MIKILLPILAMAGMCSISGERKSYRVPHHASPKKARRVQCILCGNIFKIGNDSWVSYYKCKCGCTSLTEITDVKTKSHSR
jgi:hypothetical protein